jgi:DNA-binding LytR/AlgR family response regulator
MTYKCLIVDDEYMARLLLENYAQKLPNLEIVALCENAIEALEYLRREQIDLLFLDIQMPQLSGLELVSTLRQKPAIIFTTAYSEHAVEGFRLDAIDYLLKPFSFERFVQAVNKAINYISFQEQEKTTQKSDIQLFKETNHFFVKADGRLVKIKFDDIIYIEGLKEYVSIYTATDRIITLQSLKNLEEILPATQFIRIHKSYIAATDKIQSIVGNQVEIHKKMIPIGLTYKDALLQKIGLEE